MPLPPHLEDRPGITYAQAQAILLEKGLERSIRTLQRWVARGVLSVKRITSGTVILFRDEVEALVMPEEPLEQRMLTVKVFRDERR
ncbi:MAG TPA: hypothetical protein VJ528_14310 [Geothrix sp.]|nr:hypothetical protein [Geothrix sp.]